MKATKPMVGLLCLFMTVPVFAAKLTLMASLSEQPQQNATIQANITDLNGKPLAQYPLVNFGPPVIVTSPTVDYLVKITATTIISTKTYNCSTANGSDFSPTTNYIVNVEKANPNGNESTCVVSTVGGKSNV